MIREKEQYKSYLEKANEQCFLVFFQFYYFMSIIGKKAKRLNNRFYSYIYIYFILDSVDVAYSAIMITIITWLTYSKIASQSA